MSKRKESTPLQKAHNSADQVTEGILEAAKNLMPDVDTSDLSDAANRLIEKYDLDYIVEKVPLFDADGFATGIYATKTDDHYFGPVGDDYRTLQNRNLAELVILLSRKMDAPVVFAGSYNEKAWPVFQLDFGKIEGIGKNNDEIRQFANITTSHDASYGLRIGYGDWTLSCANEFRAANRTLGRMKTIRHTLKMDKNLSRMIKETNRIRDIREKAARIYAQMDAAPINKKIVSDVTEILTGVESKYLENRVLAEDELHWSTLKKLDAVTECLHSEMSQKGETLFGLFAGATYYSTHVYGDAESRKDEKFAGHLSRTDNKVYEIIAREAMKN